MYIEQLYTFGDPARDPRTRVISVAYYALIDARTLEQAVERMRAAAPGDDRLALARLDGSVNAKLVIDTLIDRGILSR